MCDRAELQLHHAAMTIRTTATMTASTVAAVDFDVVENCNVSGWVFYLFDRKVLLPREISLCRGVRSEEEGMR